MEVMTLLAEFVGGNTSNRFGRLFCAWSKTQGSQHGRKEKWTRSMKSQGLRCSSMTVVIEIRPSPEDKALGPELN